MKRSELVDELDFIFRNRIGIENTEGATDLIVEKLEELNILPPLHYIPSGCLHTLREGCNCQGTYERKWEKED